MVEREVAHNAVNLRLANDVSSDPAFPKIRFPSKEFCPECWDDQGQPKEQVEDLFVKCVHLKKTSAYEFFRVFSPFFKAFILQSRSWAGKTETQNKVTIVFFRASIQETDFDYASSSASTVIFQSLSLVTLLLM